MNLQYACNHNPIEAYYKNYQFKINNCYMNLYTDKKTNTVKCSHTIYIKDSPYAYDNFTNDHVKFLKENGKVVKIIEYMDDVIPYTIVPKMSVDIEYDGFIVLLTSVIGYYNFMVYNKLVNSLLISKHGPLLFLNCIMNISYRNGTLIVKYMNTFDTKKENNKRILTAQTKTLVKTLDAIVFEKLSLNYKRNAINNSKINICENKRCCLKNKRLRFNFLDVSIPALLRVLHQVFCENSFSSNLKMLNLTDDLEFEEATNAFVKNLNTLY